jgi:sulfur carrier protein
MASSIRNEQGPAPVLARIEPGGRQVSLPGLRSVQALLRALGLRQTQALVIRGGELLTQDRLLAPGDEIVVRTVTSAG